MTQEAAKLLLFAVADGWKENVLCDELTNVPITSDP